MFRPLALLLAACAVAASSAGARAADEPKDILAKAIKAHGGEESLTKFQAAQTRNKGKIDIPGVGEVEFTQETAYMIPDKFKDAMELKVMGQTISVLTLINGDKVTIEAMGKEVPLNDAVKDTIKDAGYMLRVARLAPLVKEKGFDLDIIGEDKVEGKEVVGVRVSSKGHKDIGLYFDKKTHLLTKIEHRTVDPTSGNEIAEERIITEYGKDKNGLATPKKVILNRDGKKFLEAEVLEVTYLEKLDDSEFKK
jgi:hypothetical protein